MFYQAVSREVETKRRRRKRRRKGDGKVKEDGEWGVVSSLCKNRNVSGNFLEEALRRGEEKERRAGQ